MNLQNIIEARKIVVSPDVAKQLSLVQYPQNSLFKWERHSDDEDISSNWFLTSNEFPGCMFIVIAAPTAGEIGIILPKSINLIFSGCGYEMHLYITHSRLIIGDEGGWLIDYKAYSGVTLTGLLSRIEEKEREIVDANEANCRAKMYILLHEIEKGNWSEMKYLKNSYFD